MTDSVVKAEGDDESFSSDYSDDEAFRCSPRFQLCEGLREDCDRLAALVRDELTVQALFNGWNELRFHRIYMGRRFFTELLEFTEEALMLARDLWLDAERDIREQASYFLVLGGLYVRQPFKKPSYPARIRLTPKHVDLVSTFIDNCEANAFHDCVRLFDALFSEGALNLVMHPREFGLESNTLAYLHRDALHKVLPKVKAPKLKDLTEISELRMALAEYCAVKRGLEDAPDFVTSKRLDNLVPKEKEEEDLKPGVTALTGEVESIATRRQRLRNRAFGKAAAKKVSVVDTILEKTLVVKCEERPRKKSGRVGLKRPKPQRVRQFY